MVAQSGDSVGLAVTTAIAASVTEHSNLNPTDALLRGYHVGSWPFFGAIVTVVVISFFGLRTARHIRRKEGCKPCKKSRRLKSMRELMFLAGQTLHALKAARACSPQDTEVVG